MRHLLQREDGLPELHPLPVHVVPQPQHLHRQERLPRLLSLRPVHGLDDGEEGVPGTSAGQAQER